MFIAYPDLDKKIWIYNWWKQFSRQNCPNMCILYRKFAFSCFSLIFFFQNTSWFPSVFFYFARVEYKKQIFWLNLLIRQSTTVSNSQSAQIKQIRTFSAAGPNFFIPFLKILTAVLKCFSPSRFWVTGSFNTVISTLESREAPYRSNEDMGFEAWWC